MLTVSELSSRTTCRIIAGVHNLGVGRFPNVVRIETTNACNAKCIICPHTCIQRSIQRMDDAVFTKIVDECATNQCMEVHLHNFGEPLLDRSLEDRVAYAKRRGLKKVKIFSNGSLLTESRARRLIEAGLDEIKISFDGSTQEEFERIRTPLKFATVVENIKTLVRLRDEMGTHLRVGVACCSTTEKAGTMKMLEGTVDTLSFGRIHNWTEGNGTDTNGKIRKPCSRLWRTFTILSNGDVALCCLDYDGRFILGRVDEHTSIRDIFHGNAYAEVRSKHKQSRQAEISLCDQCSKSFW